MVKKNNEKSPKKFIVILFTGILLTLCGLIGAVLANLLLHLSHVPVPMLIPYSCEAIMVIGIVTCLIGIFRLFKSIEFLVDKHRE